MPEEINRLLTDQLAVLLFTPSEESLLEVNRDLAVVFPAHPRTRKRISNFGLNAGQLLLLDPLPCVDFLGL